MKKVYIDNIFSHTYYSLYFSLIDEDICQVCKVTYDDDDDDDDDDDGDDKDGWIGYDGDCNRWYHYCFAGLKRMFVVPVFCSLIRPVLSGIDMHSLSVTFVPVS